MHPAIDLDLLLNVVTTYWHRSQTGLTSHLDASVAEVGYLEGQIATNCGWDGLRRGLTGSVAAAAGQCEADQHLARGVRRVGEEDAGRPVGGLEVRLIERARRLHSATSGL